jgi:hypothetical protein
MRNSFFAAALFCLALGAAYPAAAQTTTPLDCRSYDPGQTPATLQIDYYAKTMTWFNAGVTLKLTGITMRSDQVEATYVSGLENTYWVFDTSTGELNITGTDPSGRDLNMHWLCKKAEPQS